MLKPSAHSLVLDRLHRLESHSPGQGLMAQNPAATEGAWLAVISQIDRVGLARLLYAVAIKRMIDVAAAAVLVLLFLPLMMLAMVVIWLDSPGPVIFTQDRVGRGGHRFSLYKLRTMTYNQMSEVAWFVGEDGKSRHKVRDDPRITRPGRWLRRTSIDELPQLINILKGEMSLIGPRPELPEIVERYAQWQHERHLVRPGLSGWWQVSGRSDLPMHENTELDLFYVRRQSFWLDLQIVLKTVRVTVKGMGAY